MPLEEKDRLPIMPKAIGITAQALTHILSSQTNTIENFNTLCKKLNIDRMYVSLTALKPFISKQVVTNSEIIPLFEKDNLIFVRENEITNDETLILRQYLDKKFPDNWGMIVYTVDEYISFRPYLGEEDLYNLGGDNIYVG
jgi:hypothetical protein